MKKYEIDIDFYMESGHYYVLLWERNGRNLPELIQDASWCTKESAMQVVEELLRQYPAARIEYIEHDGGLEIVKEWPIAFDVRKTTVD